MKPFQVPSAFTTTFTLEYGVSEADMRRLYDRIESKRSFSFTGIG